MSAPEFDLQAHSTRSDGALEPSAVVAAAAAAGVRLLALTDHDTVDGVEDALEAGGEHGIEVVPAIEVSAVQSGSAADVHVLGYRIDHGSPELAAASASARALAERVSSYWVNFARAGDPNGKGLPRWPAFSAGSAAPMIIGEIKETPDPQRLAMYDKLYAKILSGLKE